FGASGHARARPRPSRTHAVWNHLALGKSAADDKRDPQSPMRYRDAPAFFAKANPDAAPMESSSDARSPEGADHHETFGRYRLLERIGRGGMAVVCTATSFGVEGFDKVLVIKRTRPELVAKKRFVDLFIHEAKLAVRLS